MQRLFVCGVAGKEKEASGFITTIDIIISSIDITFCASVADESTQTYISTSVKGSGNKRNIVDRKSHCGIMLYSSPVERTSLTTLSS